MYSYVSSIFRLCRLSKKYDLTLKLTTQKITRSNKKLRRYLLRCLQQKEGMTYVDILNCTLKLKYFQN